MWVWWHICNVLETNSWAWETLQAAETSLGSAEFMLQLVILKVLSSLNDSETLLPCWKYNDCFWRLHPSVIQSIEFKWGFLLVKKHMENEKTGRGKWWWKDSCKCKEQCLFNRVMLVKNSTETSWWQWLRFPSQPDPTSSLYQLCHSLLNIHVMNAHLPILTCHTFYLLQVMYYTFREKGRNRKEWLDHWFLCMWSIWDAENNGEENAAERKLAGSCFEEKALTTLQSCTVRISRNFRESLTQRCGRAKKQPNALSLQYLYHTGL